MRFFTYLLLFKNGYLYTGSSGNLSRRTRRHQRFGDKPSVIWRQCFQTRAEAYAREVQLKGWSRAKKLALANGDLETLSKLAKRRAGKPLSPHPSKV
jgi:predicted GIY-YIG superfamily endonuclease